MQCNVAAVVDVGAREVSCRCHGGKNFFSNCAGHRGHRRNKGSLAVGGDRGGHAFRDHTAWLRIADSRGLPQKWKFATEFIEDRDETRYCCPIREVHFTSCAEGLNDEVDRAIMKMKTA